MSTLNVPISINGGTTVPTSGLSERELFIDTQRKYLYACFDKSGKAEPIKVKSADNAVEMKSQWFNINCDTPTFEVGGFKFNGEDFVSANPNTGTYTFVDMTLIDLHKLVLKENSPTYGTNLPVTGEEGQVFFKIG